MDSRLDVGCTDDILMGMPDPIVYTRIPFDGRLIIRVESSKETFFLENPSVRILFLFPLKYNREIHNILTIDFQIS